MAAVGSSRSGNKKTLDKPRVGGVDATGAWTGYGQDEQGQVPNSKACMREFYMDDHKLFSIQRDIEESCCKGLADKESVLMSMSSEPNGGNMAACLVAFKKFAIHNGMEGVF